MSHEIEILESFYYPAFVIASIDQFKLVYEEDKRRHIANTKQMVTCQSLKRIGPTSEISDGREMGEHSSSLDEQVCARQTNIHFNILSS